VIPSQINGFPKGGINRKIHSLYENVNSEKVFWDRYTNSEFRRRPFVLEFQKFMSEKRVLPLQASFNVLNFVALFFLFFSIPYVAINFGSQIQDGLYSQLLFFLSMPVLFPFLGSICTYDDILQYLLIVLFLIYFQREKYWISFILFILSCICRETSFIFLYYVGYQFFRKYGFDKKFAISILLWGFSSLFFYFYFLSFYLPIELQIGAKEFFVHYRFSAWDANFGTFRAVRESTTIMYLLTFGYLYFLLRKNKRSQIHNYNFLISFIFLNTIIVATSGLIRESRLLFLPMLLIIPVIQDEFKVVMHDVYKIMKTITYVEILVILFVCVIISIAWYSPLTTGTGYVFKLYTFVFTGFFGIVITYYLKTDKTIH